MVGANDLGGTLMNESISRAAGASHGQELTREEMSGLANKIGRELRQRNTLYGAVATERACKAIDSEPLAPIRNRDAREYRPVAGGY
jgi:FO synthase